MKRLKSHIPNAITLLNLLSGTIAVSELFKEHYANVIFLIGISLIADFFDGLLARALKAQSPIGKDLDSLADLVSFGLLPSFILYHLSEMQAHSLWNYLCFAVVLFSAIRLAKFNHDSRQNYSFIGLPTPANALLTASLLMFIIQENPNISEHSFLLKINAIIFSNFIYSETYLRIWAIVSSILLVLPLKLIALKFSKINWKETRHIWILLLGVILILITMGSLSLFWIMLWYLIWSVIWFYFIV